MPVLFFDIGETLAHPTFSDTGDLTGFDVLPGVHDVLEALKQRGLGMGIISNAGDEKPERVNQLLDACGLLGFFDSSLINYRKKDSSAAFAAVVADAGLKPEECIFVGENPQERSFAGTAGLRVAASPAIALEMVESK